MNDKKKTGLSMKTKLILAAIMLFAVLIFCFIISVKLSKEGELEHKSASFLQEVIAISELSTIEYDYNAVVCKYDDKDMEKPKEKRDVDYYVVYDGKVVSGIDFEDIDVSIQENADKVVVSLPPIEIHNIKAEPTEFIFVNEKAETEDVFRDATILCEADLNRRIEEVAVITEYAKENAEDLINKMLDPWVKSMGKSFTTEIVWREEK